MIWKAFESLTLKHASAPPARRRYSVTADIMAFQQCPIQYGAFKARRYEPALVVQLFYGTVIHQVLDRAHAHFRGELEAPIGSMPSSLNIEEYFRDVENALLARKIRAVERVREEALSILQRFNSLEGPDLYPRVLDTECRLQSAQSDYVLHGNVDVLVSGDGTGDQNGPVEIWDYKGSYKPSMGDADYQRYIFQMQVYAHLYEQKTGRAPTRAVLYFLNELGGEQAPKTRPTNALLEVELDPAEVSKALATFDDTAQDIQACHSMRSWPKPSKAPAIQTCNACDLRWNCDAAVSFSRVYQIKHP